MAEKTILEKAAEKVGYGLAMAEDVAGSVKTVVGGAVATVTQTLTHVKKAPNPLAKNVPVKNTPKKAAKKTAAKKSPTKKIATKKAAKKSVKEPAKKAGRTKR